MMDHKEATYEEIEGEVDRLLAINPDDLDGEALRNSKIFTSINRIYILKSRKLGELYTALHKLEHKRQRYYAGKESSEVYKKEPLTEAILKTDIPSHMNIDPLVVEMRTIVKETERTVKFLEDAKGQLRQRGFDIKNAIDYRKMMLGL
jgi:hypothetical protein